MSEPINARTLTVEQLTELATEANSRAEWSLANACDQAIRDVETGRYADEPTPSMLRCILALRDQAAADDTPAGRVRRLARYVDEIRALPLGNNELSHRLLAIAGCLERIGYAIEAGHFDTLEVVRAIARVELPNNVEELAALCLRRRVVDAMEPVTEHIMAAAALAILVADDLRPADLGGTTDEAKAMLAVNEPQRCPFCGCPPDAMPCRDEDGGVWNEATTADPGENCTAESYDRRQARLDQRPVGGALVPPEAAASYLALLPSRPNIFAGIGEALAKAKPTVIANAEAQAVIDDMTPEELAAMKGTKSKVVILDMAHAGFGQPFQPIVDAFDAEVERRRFEGGFLAHYDDAKADAPTVDWQAWANGSCPEPGCSLANPHEQGVACVKPTAVCRPDDNACGYCSMCGGPGVRDGVSQYADKHPEATLCGSCFVTTEQEKINDPE